MRIPEDDEVTEANPVYQSIDEIEPAKERSAADAARDPPLESINHVPSQDKPVYDNKGIKCERVLFDDRTSDVGSLMLHLTI